MTDAEDRGREERVIFALDIGTRSVTGVVGEIENGMLRVLGVETQEHAERAVVDGQIEDIEQTARVARLVKQRLEQRLGFTLSEVYVAAAGRVVNASRWSLTKRSLSARRSCLSWSQRRFSRRIRRCLRSLAATVG